MGAVFEPKALWGSISPTPVKSCCAVCGAVLRGSRDFTGAAEGGSSSIRLSSDETGDAAAGVGSGVAEGSGLLTDELCEASAGCEPRFKRRTPARKAKSIAATTRARRLTRSSGGDSFQAERHRSYAGYHRFRLTNPSTANARFHAITTPPRFVAGSSRCVVPLHSLPF